MTQYPNEEIRVVAYKPRYTKFSYDETHETHIETGTSVLPSPDFGAEESDRSLLDIGSKLASQTASTSDAPKPGFGELPKRRPFSRYGRRMLMRVGGVFNQEGFRPQDTVFFTGTLPASTPEAFEAMASYSAYLVHRLKSWVNYHYKGQYDFYVWEHQKRGALHLHYAAYIPQKDVADKLIASFPQEWVRLLQSVGNMSGVDMFDTGRGFSHTPEVAASCQYAQNVRFDVSRYLSKYVSKTATGDTSDENQSKLSPSRWYGVSRHLLAKMRDLSIERIFYIASLRETHEKCEEVYGYLANIANVCHAYRCKRTGFQLCVGYQSHWSIDELCLRINLMNQNSKQQSKVSVKPSEWTRSYLLMAAKRYTMTPHHLSKNSSQTAVMGAEKLYQSGSLSIAETMDVCHAIRWSLWYKFRDRIPPSSYAKDMATMDELYSKILTLKLRANARGDEDLSILDDPGLTGKSF
jgi:hypothetical protein